VIGMTLDGYPGLERFYLPAAGVTCVLAGVGMVRVAELASRGRVVVAVAVIAALVAVTIPFTGGRVNEARRQERVASAAVTRLDQLSAAVAAVGGHDRVYPCKSSFAAVNHSVQTALAYKLGVTLDRVGTSMRHQGVMFVGPHDSIDGAAAAINPHLTSRQLLAVVGAWRVYRMTKPGADQRCVGS
jgi:type II secretory pathway pseudopilin PulG